MMSRGRWKARQALLEFATAKAPMTRISPQSCPGCGVLNAVIHGKSDPDDVIFVSCIRCGTLGRFEDGAIRVPTAEELARIPVDKRRELEAFAETVAKMRIGARMKERQQ